MSEKVVNVFIALLIVSVVALFFFILPTESEAGQIYYARICLGGEKIVEGYTSDVTFGTSAVSVKINGTTYKTSMVNVVLSGAE